MKKSDKKLLKTAPELISYLLVSGTILVLRANFSACAEKLPTCYFACVHLIRKNLNDAICDVTTLNETQAASQPNTQIALPDRALPRQLEAKTERKNR